MLGAIIGDIAGSRFERNNIKSKDFVFFDERCRLTDDSMMTLAVAKAIMETEKKIKPSVSEFGFDIKYDELLSRLTVKSMQELGRRYPDSGYGKNFIEWLFSDKPKPYGSFGNGAAMRISPAGWAARTEGEAINLSEKITEVSHNSEEGLKGAEAVTVAIYMANHGYLKSEIRHRITLNYYPLDFTIDEIRPTYQFSATCQGSVPQAIVCFLESCSFEDAVRTAISLGGDSDTLGAIAGSIAEAYYGIPDEIIEKALIYLPDELRKIVEDWQVYMGSGKSRFMLLTKYIAPFAEESAIAGPSSGQEHELIDEDDDFNDDDVDLPAGFHFPVMKGRDDLNSFVKEVYEFSDSHPQYAMTDCHATLEKLGIKRDSIEMAAADPAELDAQGILALIIGATRVDRFAEGALMDFLEDGSLAKWLKRLKQIDQESAPGKLKEIYLEIGKVSDTMIYQALVQDEEVSLFRHKFLDEKSSREPYSMVDPEELNVQWNDIHSEYWKSDYPNEKLPIVYDGEQWLLFVQKDGQRGDIYKGDNTYPPNWDKLLNIFRIQKQHVL